MQRHNRCLDRKDQQQQHRRQADAHRVSRINQRHPFGQIRHIQRAGLGVERAEGKQEER